MKRSYPGWALPKLESVGIDYKHAMHSLGGQARARDLTPLQLARIARKGGQARARRLTKEQIAMIGSMGAAVRYHNMDAGERRSLAQAAAAVRWAGHVKKVKPKGKPRGWNAAEAGKKGAAARWGDRA